MSKTETNQATLKGAVGKIITLIETRAHQIFEENEDDDKLICYANALANLVDKSTYLFAYEQYEHPDKDNLASTEKPGNKGVSFSSIVGAAALGAVVAGVSKSYSMPDVRVLDGVSSIETIANTVKSEELDV